MGVLDREARGVAVRWIGHGGLLASKPEAVITPFEVWCQGCEIKRHGCSGLREYFSPMISYWILHPMDNGALFR